MDTLVSYCKSENLFKPAYKKIRKYRQVFSHDDEFANTFYIHDGKPIDIVTSINNEKETHAIARQGDYVITGPLHEKYVIRSVNLPTYYNLTDGFLHTRQVQRVVAKITKQMFTKLKLPIPLSFTTSWGEIMILKPGDFLVQDSSNYYRVEKNAFHMTYKL